MNTATATHTAPATVASLKAKAERAQYRYDDIANELDEAQYEAELARNECDEFAEGGRLTEWERELLGDMKREARRLETVARRLAVKLTKAEQDWCVALETLGTAEGEAIVSEAQAQAEAKASASVSKLSARLAEVEAEAKAQAIEEAFNTADLPAVEITEEGAILAKVYEVTGVTPASIAKAYGWTVDKAERVIIGNAKAGNMGSIIHSAIEAEAEYEASAYLTHSQAIEKALNEYITERDNKAEVTRLEREADNLKENRRASDAIGEAAFNRYRNTGEKHHAEEVQQYIENTARINNRLDEISARLIELGNLNK